MDPSYEGRIHGACNYLVAQHVLAHLSTKKDAILCPTISNLVLRIMAFSFSFIASAAVIRNNRSGFTYRGTISLLFLVSLNSLACLYSAIQTIFISISLASRTCWLQNPVVQYVSFVADQMIAYLLLASCYWASTSIQFGKDQIVLESFCSQVQKSNKHEFFGIWSCFLLCCLFSLSSVHIYCRHFDALRFLLFCQILILEFKADSTKLHNTYTLFLIFQRNSQEQSFVKRTSQKTESSIQMQLICQINC